MEIGNFCLFLSFFFFFLDMFYYHGWWGEIAFITAGVQTRDSNKGWKLKGVTFNDRFVRFRWLWRGLAG